MTFIKKYFKVILCFMAFALVSLAFAFAPTYTALAASQTINASYKLAISGIKIKDVDLNSDNKEFKIPLNISKFENATLTVRVYEPNVSSYHDYPGTDEFFQKKDGDDSNIYVNVNHLTEGTYRVVYIVKDNAGKIYASTPYEVKVSNVEYEFVEKLVDKNGSKILLPSKMLINSAKAYKLPINKIKNIADEKEENLVSAPDNITLTKDHSTTIELKDGTSAEDYSKIFFKYDGEYYFVPTETGVYTLTYNYSKGSSYLSDSIEFEVQSSTDYVAPSKNELKISKPSINNIVLGKTGITLTDVVMSTKEESAIEHNTVIVVKHGEYSQTLNNTFTLDMTLEAFKNADGENPTSWSDLKGDYDFIYTATDAYGREATTTVTKKDIANSEEPNITMSYDYDVDAEGKLVDATIRTDKEVQFNTTMGYNEIVVPAVYATDVINGFQDMSFVRYIHRPSNSQNYYVDNVKKDGSNLVALKITENDDGTFSFEQGWNFALVSSDVKFVDSETVLGSEHNGKYIVEVKDNKFTYKGIYNSTTKEFDTTSDAAKLWKEKLGQRDLIKARIETNKQQKFEFAYNSNAVKDGDFDDDYEIKYCAILNNSAKTRSNDTKSYSITVTENAEYENKNDKSPIVTFDTEYTIPNEIESTDELKVNIVSNNETDSKLKTILLYSYSDFKINDSDPSNTNTLVKKVEKAINTAKTDSKYAYSHVFDNNAFRTSLSNFYFVEQSEDKANEFKFTLKDVDGKKVVYVVAMSMNNEGVIGYTSIKEIEIKTTSSDNTAPTFDGSATFDNELEVTEEGKVVNLPTVTFSDDIDKYLSLSAKYYVINEKNEDVSLYDYNDIDINGEVTKGNTIGGSITPAENAKGTYYVVYTAMDDAGNTTVMYFTFKVADREVASAIINASGTGLTHVAGGDYTAKAGTIIAFDAIVTNGEGYDKTSEATDKDLTVSGKGWSPVGKNTYLFKEIGDYKVNFTATYNGKPVTATICIKINSMPEVEWVNAPERIGDKPVSGSHGYLDLDTEVEIKMLEVTRGENLPPLAVDVKVTDKDKKEVELIERNGKKFFKSSTKGTFTVTYTAYASIVDMEEGKNSVDSKTYTIKVGDDENPVLNISNKAKLEESIVLEGEVIDYKLNISNEGKIEVVIENNGKITKIDTGFTMSDIDSKGNKNELDKYDMTVTFSSDADYSTKESSTGFKHYKLEEAGKYTVKIKVEDGNGNSNETTYSFNVINKATVGKDNKDNKLGIILIIVSSVLLVGIVAFFLIASRKGKGRNKKSKKNTVVESNEVDNKNDDVKSGDVE